MRVLIAAPRLPFPPNRGDRLRTYAIVRAALGANHDVALVGATTGASAPDVPVTVFGAPLNKWTWAEALLRMVRDPRPFQALYFANKRFVQAFDRAVQVFQPDVVVLRSTRLYPLAARQAVPAVLDACDCQTLVYERERQVSRSWLKRMALGVEVRRLRRYEPHMADQVRAVYFASPVDASYYATSSAGVIPLSLPASYWTRQPLPEEPVLCYVGTLSAVRNSTAVEWFVKQAFPLVKAQVPDVRLLVAGLDPPASIRALVSSGVEVHASPADIRPLVYQSRLMLCPVLSGGGVKTKILEAVMAGRPVVCTTLATEGLPDTRGALAVGDTPERFAAECVRLLRDREAAMIMVQTAADRFGDYFATGRVQQLWVRAIEDAAAAAAN